jgi:hypothetical protein
MRPTVSVAAVTALMMLAAALMSTPLASAADGKPAVAKPDAKPATKASVKAEPKAAEAPAGPFMGEYEGTFTPGSGAAVKAIAKVFGLPKDLYGVVLILPAAKEGEKETRLALQGKADGETKLVISGKVGDAEWNGTLEKQQLVVEAKGEKGGKFDLKSCVRKSPTEGKKPPQGAVVLLPFEEGKETNLDAWTNKNWKLLPDGSAQVNKGDSLTVKEFGDVELHVEFTIPYMPTAAKQGRGNSGVYIQDRYEMQILDSFGVAPQKSDCGSIYTQTAPKADACLPPLRWQTYDITFHAPRLDAAGKVVKNVTVTMLFNGVKVHDNVEVPNPTGSARSKAPVKLAPLKLQDHGYPIRFRNVWLVELKGE